MIHHTPALKFLKGLKGTVNLVLTSPPYNIGGKGIRSDGQRRQGISDAKSYGGIAGYDDSLPEAEYQQQQVALLRAARDALTMTGTIVYNHKPRRKNLAMVHPMTWISKVKGLTLMEEIIWDRGSTHNHSNRVVWQHTERLYVLRRTEGAYTFRNEADLPFRSDIWKVALSNTRIGGHACPMPLALAEAAVQAFSSKGDLVVDPYCGTATSAIAALRHGRTFKGAETDRKFVDYGLTRIMEIAA